MFRITQITNLEVLAKLMNSFKGSGGAEVTLNSKGGIEVKGTENEKKETMKWFTHMFGGK